jgi:single-stranded-DNA-specific exonuclease
LEEAGIPANKITSTTVGFQIGPRINAAGRLDDPQHAFELLIGKLEKAEILNKLNEERRLMTKKYIDEAIAKIKKKKTIPNIIILKSKKWCAGLLGLIASGISEKYNRPTIVMQEKKDELVGSMRSVNQFDITECLREAAEDLFNAFGGHVMAGGFTMPKKNLKEFMKQVEEAGKSKINPDEFVSTLNIDCEVKPEELNFETCYKLSRLEPFGAENPEPKLLIKNAKILNIRPVGKGEHLHLPMRCGDKTVGAIAFRFGKHLDKIDQKKPHDIVFNLEINEWNGNKRLQMRVVDLKPSE